MYVLCMYTIMVLLYIYSSIIKVGLGGVLVVCGECYNLGKLISLLLFCLLLLSIMFMKTLTS